MIIVNSVFPRQGFVVIGIVVALSVFIVILGLVLSMKEFLPLAFSRAPSAAIVETHNTKIVEIQALDTIGSDKSTGLRQVFVTVQNDGNHVETVGVYLDVIPPNGSSNPGGCFPTGRIIQNSVTLNPGQQKKVSVDTNKPQERVIDFGCINYLVVTGQSYKLIAAADNHGDDLEACSEGSLISQVCINALASDDSEPIDNRQVMSKPQIQ